ncbi:MAG: hypothetical protein Q9O62_05390 [Ardenticatenia bacterium]|nr:hypothetical protein [Ardenticatenia bacterium]
MNRATQLLMLQKVELEIQDKMRLLRQVHRALNNTEELEALRQQYNGVQNDLKKLESLQREMELELEGISQRIEEHEQELYSGAIRNPKELAARQKEVEALKRRRDRLDERLIASLETTEKFREKVNSLRERLQEAEAKWEAQRGKWEEIERKLKRYLVYLRHQRDELRQSIPPADLSLYEDLVRLKGGIAVAELKDGACSACGVGVSQGKIESVRRSTGLITCGNCERILAIVT